MNLVFLLIVEVLTIPVFAFLFLQGGGYAGAWWMIPLVLTAGSIGIAGNTKGKDFVLAVLMVPLMYPLLLAAVAATTVAVLGGDGSTSQFWSAMGGVAGYDVIMILAAYALYEFVIGA